MSILILSYVGWVGGKKFHSSVYVGCPNESKFLRYMLKENLNWHKQYRDDGPIRVVPTDSGILVGLLALVVTVFCQPITSR